MCVCQCMLRADLVGIGRFLWPSSLCALFCSDIIIKERRDRVNHIIVAVTFVIARCRVEMDRTQSRADSQTG